MAFAAQVQRGEFAESLLEESLWPMVKADLDYVASYWNQTGFDLWEELNAASFFTSAVQHRSLREGVALAISLGHTDEAAVYEEQADNLLCFMQVSDSPCTVEL